MQKRCKKVKEMIKFLFVDLERIKLFILSKWLIYFFIFINIFFIDILYNMTSIKKIKKINID